MSAKYIVLVGHGVQINLTPKMRTHLLTFGLIYRSEKEKDENKEVYLIEDERSWDDVNSRLSELPPEELNINPAHAEVVHVEDNEPNFDLATPIADYAVSTNVDIPEDDPLHAEVDNKRKERDASHDSTEDGQVRAFRVATEDEGDTEEADELHDEAPDLEEDDEDDGIDGADDGDDTGNVLFNTSEADKEPDYDEVVQSYDVVDPSERDQSEDPSNWPEGWWAVNGPSGIDAYFENESDAFAWRLFKINVVANQHNALRRYNKGFGRE